MNEVITGISTKFNFIHIANGGGAEPGGNAAQTGDFWQMFIVPVLLIALFAAIAYVYANKKRFAKINYKLLSAIVIPAVLFGGVVAGVSNANAIEEEFTGKQIDVYVNEAGGPVTYGEGETSNIQKLTNVTDDIIWFNEIDIADEAGTSFVGHWTAIQKDGTKIFEGGAGDSYCADKDIVLEAGESTTITWTCDTDSAELLNLEGPSPVSIEYKLNDPHLVITLEPNGGTPQYPPIEVRYGETPSPQPEDPEKEDFVFKGWFTEKTLENPVDWNLPVYRSATYYAKWSIDTDYLAEQLQLVKTKSDASTNAVNNCKYLSETQMAEYNATISQAVKDANAGIRNAQSVEEVEAIQQNLDSSLLPTVKEALDEELTICTDTNKEDIASADYMTENYINTTNGLVDEASEAGHSQIEAATTIPDIVTAKNSCESSIETYKTQTLAFSESKSNALTELQTFADTNIATIDGLTDYLSAAERATCKESIAKENNDGNDKIKNEVDLPAELSPVVSATEAAISEITTNAQNLHGARSDAITTANTAASGMIKALSDSSSWFTSAYIESEIANVNAKVQTLTNNVMKSTNPADIKSLSDMLVSEFKIQKVGLEQLVNDKRTVDEDLNTQITSYQDSINSLKLMSKSYIKNLQDKFDSDVTTAHDTIINATKGSDLSNVLSVFISSVQTYLLDAIELNKYKGDAMNELMPKVDEAIANITITKFPNLCDQDIQYCKSDLADIKENCKTEITKKDTMEDAQSLIEEYTSRIEPCLTFANQLNKKKGDSQATLTTYYNTHLDLVKAEEGHLTRPEDYTFYINRVNDLYSGSENGYQSKILNYPAQKAMHDLDQVLEDANNDFTACSDGAQNVETWRGDVKKTVLMVGVELNLNLRNITDLKENDKEYITDEYKNEVVKITGEGTDICLNMHLEAEFTEAVANIKEISDSLLSDAKEVPGFRNTYKNAIDKSNTEFSDWIQKLAKPTTDQKNKAVKDLNNTAREQTNALDNDAHTKAQLDAVYSSFNMSAVSAISECAKTEITGFYDDTVKIIDQKRAESLLNEFDFKRFNQMLLEKFDNLLAEVDKAKLPNQVKYSVGVAIDTYETFKNDLCIVGLQGINGIATFEYGEGSVTGSSFNVAGLSGDVLYVTINVTEGHTVVVKDNTGTSYGISTGKIKLTLNTQITKITVEEVQP